MIPYRNISVKTAMHIVLKINAFEDLRRSRYGGGEEVSRRSPERKFLSPPILLDDVHF